MRYLADCSFYGQPLFEWWRDPVKVVGKENGEMVCSDENQQRCFHSKIRKELQGHYDKLIEELLGKGYYNYGMDVYSCNAYALEDMLREIKRLKRTNLRLSIYLGVNAVFCVLLLVANYLK